MTSVQRPDSNIISAKDCHVEKHDGVVFDGHNDQIKESALFPESFITKNAEISYPSFFHLLKKVAAIVILLIGLSSSSLVAQTIDLSLHQTIDNAISDLDSQVNIKLNLVNQSTNTATGLEVQSKLPSGAVTYIGNTASSGSATYNLTDDIISWNVASLAGQDTATLEITTRITERGLHFVFSQVTEADQNDIDSSPANNILSEDDMASSCFSLPLFWYPGEKYTKSIPGLLNSGAGVTWFKDGQVVTSTTPGVLLNSDQSITISSPGDFTFETSIYSCQPSSCCTLKVEQGPFGKIGDFVWKDNNQNGIQDIDEPGIPGVSVSLKNGDGVLLTSTKTDSTGKYQFDSLMAGDYSVVFGIPSKFRFTELNEGLDKTIDSDADLITGVSSIINLTSGLEIQTVDAGLYPDSTCHQITSISSSENSVCPGNATLLSAISSNNSDITWYSNSAGGSPISTVASGSSFEVNPAQTITYYAELASPGTLGCPNPRVPLTIEVFPVTSGPVIGTAVEVCTDEKVNLNDYTSEFTGFPSSIFEWHILNNPQSALVTNINAVGEGTYYLFEKSASNCYTWLKVLSVKEKNCSQFIDLSLVKAADNRNVYTGDSVTYTITITNAGPDTATNIVIEDIMPEGLTFISSSDFTHNAGSLRASTPYLASNETRILTYVAKVSADKGSLVNLAQVINADQPDIDSTPGNSSTENEDDDDDEIINVISPNQTADLRLQKLVSDKSPSSGDLINYTIRVSNDGPDEATNVKVEDILPKGLTYISSTNSSYLNGVVVANFESIQVGLNAFFTISVRVDSAGTIINSAEITAAEQFDPDSTPKNGTGANEDDDDSVSILATDDCNPTTPIISTTKAYICAGEFTTLNAAGCNGNVNWSNGETGVSITISPASNTTYTATCTVNNCESSPSNQLTVAVNSLTAPAVSANKSTICRGESVILQATNCLGTVTWNNDSAAIGTGSSITVTPSKTTSYMAICQVNTCLSPASTPLTVSVNTNLTAPVISASSQSICFGQSVTLSATNCSGTVSWSSGQTGASVTVSPNITSTYTANCSVGSCTSANSNGLIITVGNNQKPIILSSATSICTGDSAILTVNETAAGYLWSNGESTKSIIVKSGGEYAVQIVNDKGCLSSASKLTITVDNCKTNEQNADVAINLSGNSSAINNNLVTYTITVSNYGPDTATAILIENEIPVGIEIIGDTPGLTKNGNKLTATITTLAVNDSKNFNYTAKITKSGIVTSQAKIVSLNQTDPDISNNLSNFDISCKSCEEECIATALHAQEELQNNGTYNVVFTSLVQNCGSSLLEDVNLTFDMATMFGNQASFTLVGKPKVNSGSALETNASYNGGTVQNILISAGSSIQPSAIDTITWTINVIPNGDYGPFSGNSLATGVAEANLSTGTEVSDLSNDGLLIDLSDATPTSVRLYKTPGIGIALAIIDTLRKADESLNVTYQAIIKNNGDLDLYDVVVKDALSETYLSPVTYSMVGVPTTNTGSSLQINMDFDGDQNDALTLTASTLAVGVADTIWFTVNVRPNDKTEFENQATVQATGTLEDNRSENVTDVSNSGLNPDALGRLPTILKINNGNSQSDQKPCIGSALYTTEVTKLENGTVDVTYKAILKNCGNVTLNNIRLYDSLSADFGTPVVVVLKDAPTVNSGSTLTVDSNYDGINNVYILDSTSSTLDPGKTDTISWTINLTLNGNEGPFRKNVTIKANTEGSNKEVSDTSNDGMDPDPEGEDPTVLNFKSLPDDIIGIAKKLVSIEKVEGNVYDVVFDFTLKNFGKIDFTGVQIQDNLELTFGEKVAIDSVKVFNASEGLTVNDNYTGKDLLIDLLIDSSSTLAVNTSKTVSLFTRVDLTNADTTRFVNMALAIGYHNGTTSDDQSTSGTNPDADDDGTPYNNSIPTLIDFGEIVEPENETPLGIAKAVTDTVSIVDGSYHVTYTIIVKNYGDTDLNNVQLKDSLSGVFTDNTDFVLIVPPEIIDTNSSLKVNLAYDGISDLNILDADSSSLASGESDTLTLKVKVRNNGSEAMTYNNTVYGSASDGAKMVTDKSNAGLNPDSDADNNPGNNNQPTPLTLKAGENTSNPSVTVLIPGGISPNEDGLNDNLIIEGIEEEDNVSLKIYNRWGQLVFETDNYKKLFPGSSEGWNGQSNTGKNGKVRNFKLPDGIYFYAAESPNIELFGGKPYYNFITMESGTKK